MKTDIIKETVEEHHSRGNEIELSNMLILYLKQAISKKIKNLNTRELGYHGINYILEELDLENSK